MSSIPASPAAQPAPVAEKTAASARPAPFSPLRAIIRKELAENTKWVVGGYILQTIVVAIFVWANFYNDDRAVQEPIHVINALFDSGFRTITVGYCIGSGLLLGLMQIFTERALDLRAFLRHRVITPSRLFLAKALSGLILYSFAVGLPILLLICWAATAKKSGLMFDIQFTRPYLVFFLGGLAYYFAGLIAAQRQARWFASRAVPIAAAVLASLCTFAFPEFWQALIIVILITALLAMAAWNCYVNAGMDITLGQPAPPASKLPQEIAPLVLVRRFTTPLVMLLALSVIFSALFGADVVTLKYLRYDLPPTPPDPRPRDVHYSSYEILSNGLPARHDSNFHIDAKGQTTSRTYTWTDLAGNPVAAGVATRRESAANVSFIAAKPYLAEGRLSYLNYSSTITYLGAQSAYLGSDEPKESYPSLNDKSTAYWIYNKRTRLFIQYDSTSYAPWATIGASGYSRMHAEPFPASSQWDDDSRTLLVGNRLLQLHFSLAGPEARTIYQVPADETLRWIIKVYVPAPNPVTVTSQPSIAAPHFELAIVTDKKLHLLGFPGGMDPVISIPLEHPLDQFGVQVTYRPFAHRFTVHYSPTEPLNETQYISTFNDSGVPENQFTLPPLSQETMNYYYDQIPTGTAIPVFFTLGIIDSLRNPFVASNFPWDTIGLAHNEHPWDPPVALPIDIVRYYGTSAISFWYYSGLFLPILLSTAFTLFLTTRYRFTRAGRTSWTLATLAFGPLALLTLLFTQPLPARLPCPACKNKRPATLPLCPHCHTPFPAPTPTGNEIFTNPPPPT